MLSLLKNKRKWLLVSIDAAIFVSMYAFTLLFYTIANSDALNQKTFPLYVLHCAIFAFFVFTARFLLSTYSNIWR